MSEVNKKMVEVMNLLICSRTSSSVSNNASKNLMENQCNKNDRYRKKEND
jgi:hypothetical protein